MLGFDPTTPVVFTNVAAGPLASVTATRTISSDNPPETLTAIDPVGAGCAAYTITFSNTLPHNVTSMNTIEMMVEFHPLTRGSFQCTVTLLTGAAPNGTFVINGTAVAPVISTTPATGTTFLSVRATNGVVQSSTQSIRISNTTTDTGVALTVNTLGFGGTNPTDFSISSSPSIPASIPPGSFIDVTLTFNPATAGNKSATFLITTNDPAMPSKSINLDGTGTNAIIATGTAAFGIVGIGSSAPGSISVTNSAGSFPGTLTLTSASIAQGSTWFTFDGNGCTGTSTPCTFSGLIAPTSIAVRCSPPIGATGSQNAVITVNSDTDAGGVSTGSLSCTAGRPDITVTPATMMFADQAVSTTSPAQQITVRNTGNTLLTYNIAKMGGQPAAFGLSPACPVAGCTLAGGGMTTHAVTFTPPTNTLLGTTFVITSDDPDLADKTKTVVVSGTGTGAQLGIAGSLDFMTVELPDTRSLMITGTNTGNAPLNITSSTITAGGSDYTVTAGGTGVQPPIAAGGTITWTIRCNPSMTGPRPGTFSIASNTPTALGGSPTNVTLSCAGNQGALVTAPVTTAGAPLDFAGVTVGSTSTLSFMLRNPGNVPVTGIAGVLAPANVGYSIDPATPIPPMLNPGQAVTINLRFSPTATMDGGPATIMFTGNWGSLGKTAAVTLFIAGDGLTVGYDVVTIPTSAPPMLDFGSFRFDTTATATFCIVNTDQAPIAINSVAIDVVAPTIPSELVVTAIRRNATCAVTASAPVALPQTLTTGQNLVVTVTADPNTRTGLLEGTVTVTSNLTMNPLRTVALTGMSTTAMLTTTPGLSIDFGNVDRDGPPATRMVTITNTGTAPLDLSAFARNPTTGPFTFALPANQSVPVGGKLDVLVTYTPTVEHATNAFDQVVVTHNIAGVLNGPTSQTIMIRGRGTDRHISLAAPPTFPETFRNPGSKGPIMPVTVMNTGEATLSISAVMVTNSDVWHVIDSNPVDIPALGSHSFMVRFEPKMMGIAPVGQLVFMNNDNSLPAPIATINLTGTGLDRHVVMTSADGLPTIDLGLTAIGIPVTLPDGLKMVNQDGAHEFEIREITFVDSAQFSIADSPAGVTLPAGATQTYSVVFTPSEEGPFETSASLFLDEDPLATTTVNVKGEAVFVEVTGSGGCSTGGGTGAGALIVIGALALRRRKKVAAAVVALGLALVAWPQASHAESDIELSLFNPAPSTTGTGFQVQPASVGENGAFAAAATVSYATDPLVLKFSGTEHMSITQRTTMQLGLAYAFLGKFEAGARMPLYNQSGDGTMVNIQSPSGTARGDLVLHGKAQFARAAGGQVLAGALLSLTLPTATGEEFAGVESPTGRIYGLLTLQPDAAAKRISLTANVGAVLRKRTTFQNLEQGSGFAWGLGGSVRLLDQLWATGEMFGDVMPSSQTNMFRGSSKVLAPAEYLVGFMYRPDRRFSLGIAGGRGLVAGAGTPDIRGVFSLSFVPGTAELAPIHPPPPPKIDGDLDGDGIKDSVDRCPEVAEDKDMFDDTDGCPDADNDSDGFEDAKDMCPLDAEDKDGFQDDDGCPDKDNDNDAVPDAQDKCPSVPEDKDGFLDVDGCPDPDNDNDGILDAQDMCPNEPETINGNTDEDGCPDRGDALVIVTPAGVETVEAIQFSGTKVAKASSNVLGQIAATLRAHQEIVRVKLVVHVQPTGDAEKDQELSDKRAAAVRDWLVQWGIPQARLSVQGLGGTKPLVPRTAKQAQLINDRVEMIILERK